MPWLVSFLIFLLVVLQYKLWLDDGSYTEVWRLGQAVEAQKLENNTLRERNAALEAEVEDLKKGTDAIEERARNELGMVGKGEIFYQIVEPHEAHDKP